MELECYVVTCSGCKLVVIIDTPDGNFCDNCKRRRKELKRLLVN